MRCNEKIYIRSGAIASVLLFIFSNSMSQSVSPETSIPARYNQYRASQMQEKIFVHTDKGMYITGEICWFRLYYVNAVFGLPETFSKIAYVELLDRNNLAVLQEKISLKPGEAMGSVVIPDNIPSGNYRFRAYTSWMKNFDPEYFFDKTIRIINPRELAGDSSSAGHRNYDIQFFPEGGNLVQQIESKVAFRIADEHGRGVQCGGILLNQRGDTILHFQTLHAGLGNVDFRPADGQTYKALVFLPKGEKVEKELPAAYRQGCVMSVSSAASGALQITVQSSPEYEGEKVYLFVHGNRNWLPVKKQNIVNRTADFVLPREDLEDGISQCTLFNQQGEPVCERLYFKYPEKKLWIHAEAGNEFSTRKKIDLNVYALDSKGIRETADMSMAVYKLDSLQDVDECDIRSYFYLESELGRVEDPAFYLDSARSTEADRNNLMMTRGWRRYRWKNGLDATQGPMVFPPEILGHIVHGKLTGRAGAVFNHADAYLSVPSVRTQFRISSSDAEGNVTFELRDFYGSEEIIVQTDPKADSSLHVEILSPFSSKFSIHPLPEFSIPNKNSRQLLYRAVRGQVQQVYVGAAMNHFSSFPVDTNRFYVVPDGSYLLDNYTRFQTMEEVMREYIQFASVSRKNDKFQLMLADKPRMVAFHEPPLMLIDGVPFFDADEIFHQDPKMIKRIELVNRQYALGNKTFEGIVNMNTYLGDLNGIILNPRATILEYPGLQEEREFFSPVYETEEQISSRMPDDRSLLYWNPYAKPGDQHFYSSDLPGKYAIVVQGLSADGVPGGKVVYFSVKK